MLSANAKIIFVSCIDAKRSIKDVATEWDYNYSSGKLYHGNSQEELVKNKFVSKSKKGKYVYYQADMKKFTKYLSSMVSSMGENDEIQANMKNVLSENIDLFAELLSLDFVVKDVFSLKNVKMFFKNDRTIVPECFDSMLFSVYLSLVLFFMTDGQKNRDRLLHIFSMLLLNEFGTKADVKGFVIKNIETFGENREKLADFKVLYDEFQELL